MNNCPNCGAPIVSSQCEYCGTVFPDYRSDSKYTELLEQQITIQALYDRAISAMRAYSSGILTANEARKMIGLKEFL